MILAWLFIKYNIFNIIFCSFDNIIDDYNIIRIRLGWLSCSFILFANLVFISFVPIVISDIQISRLILLWSFELKKIVFLKNLMFSIEIIYKYRKTEKPVPWLSWNLNKSNENVYPYIIMTRHFKCRSFVIGTKISKIHIISHYYVNYLTTSLANHYFVWSKYMFYFDYIMKMIILLDVQNGVYIVGNIIIM